MKMSNTILTTLLAIGIAGLFGSNYSMKNEFDKIDKTDPYWTYKKIEDRPFSHLVISGGNISNIVFEQSLEKANEVESALILTRRHTIDRIIISKIVEYDELCQKFFQHESPEADEFYVDLKRKYEKINSEIKAEKWARILRNKTSFHYDERYAFESLGKLDGAHPLRMILGRMSGVTLLEFSEEVLSRAIFERAGAGDIEEGIGAADRFIVNSIRVIRDFHAKALIEAFKKYGLVTKRESMELRDEYCGSIGIDRVPISILPK